MNATYGFTYRRSREMAASVGRWLLALLLGLALSVQADGSQTQPLDSGAVEALLLRHVRQAEPRRLENLELRVLPFQPVLLRRRGAACGWCSRRAAARRRAKFSHRRRSRRQGTSALLGEGGGSGLRSSGSGGPAARAPRNSQCQRLAPGTARNHQPHGPDLYRLDDVVGKQSTRSIQSDDVITANAIERPTLLKRGSPITLVFDSGSLRVETQGVAEEGGKMGDLIQVKNSTSGKMLRGMVLDERNVRVN